MKISKLLLCLLLCLCMVSSAFAEPLQACHKVTMDKIDTKQENRSVVRLWTVDTVLDSVDA